MNVWTSVFVASSNSDRSIGLNYRRGHTQSDGPTDVTWSAVLCDERVEANLGLWQLRDVPKPRRLWTYDIAKVLKTHSNSLKTICRAFALEPPNGGPNAQS